MAQVDYFLKIDGIDGESSAKGHEKWIELLSFSFGAHSNINPATGNRVGRTQFTEFSFGAMMQKHSPKLLLACASGTHIKKAVLELVHVLKDQAQSFATIKLTDVLVSSYVLGGVNNTEPLEDAKLAFHKMEFDFSGGGTPTGVAVSTTAG